MSGSNECLVTNNTNLDQTSDGAAVMSGSSWGVQAIVKKKIF